MNEPQTPQSIKTILWNIQQRLCVPKTQSSKNKAGAEMFKFRDYPQIVETLKPMLKEYGCLLLTNSEVEHIGDRYYIKATVRLHLIADGSEVSATALAREGDFVGMNSAQSTGSAESYALKRAASNLFAIDDGTKDPDTTSEGADWLTKIDTDLWNAACALKKAQTIDELSKINGQYAYLAASRVYRLFGTRAKERIIANQNSK